MPEPIPHTAPEPRPAPSRDKPHRTLRFGVGPEWSSAQLALGATSSTGAALYLVALHQAAGGFDPVFWALAAVPMLTLSLAGSGASLAYWALMLYGWFVLTDEASFSWWALPAAVGLLVSHTATALSASVPPAGMVATGSLHRWGRGVAVAVGAAAVVAVAAAALVGRPLDAGSAAYVIGLLGLSAGIWLVRNNPPSERE
jgi:hypothetical protein